MEDEIYFEVSEIEKEIIMIKEHIKDMECLKRKFIEQLQLPKDYIVSILVYTLFMRYTLNK